MEIKGEKSYRISKELLWTYLMDPEVLAKITPGVSNLVVLGEGIYESVSEIKIGPVKGRFKGKLTISDLDEPNSFVINMEQMSKIGNAHAKVNMVMVAIGPEETLLKFDSNAKLSGLIARTGQRVLSGVANAVTKEVFTSLEKYIEENRTTT